MTWKTPYSFIWWRGLWRCLRRGHHLWVFGHGVPEKWWYCWDCFYGYPWDRGALTLGKRFRSWVGAFLPKG